MRYFLEISVKDISIPSFRLCPNFSRRKIRFHLTIDCRSTFNTLQGISSGDPDLLLFFHALRASARSPTWTWTTVPGERAPNSFLSLVIWSFCVFCKASAFTTKTSLVSSRLTNSSSPSSSWSSSTTVNSGCDLANRGLMVKLLLDERLGTEDLVETEKQVEKSNSSKRRTKMRNKRQRAIMGTNLLARFLLGRTIVASHQNLKIENKSIDRSLMGGLLRSGCADVQRLMSGIRCTPYQVRYLVYTYERNYSIDMNV